ncbi:alpha/beta hydrolase [Kribbella sp. NPDC023855]|uniref:alpha/beta fold hydrolase n=1 Tax=Kribbella sp. NPDC023855 TaxID=3154698 RepID=UPI0033DC61AA
MVSSQSDTRMVDVHAGRLAVHTWGVGAPAVVFISGLGDPASVWQPVIARLGKLTTFLTYDRAGVGESGDLPPRDAETPMPASWAARQLHDLLTATLAGQRVVLVGHSLGGQIADAFAIKWPELVAGLVLVDAVDAELYLKIRPQRPVFDDATPDRAGRGWKWDVAASAAEYGATEPAVHPPTVVVTSAIWRWFEAKQPELYRPLSLAEVDQRWQLAQLHHARRWRGELVVAHEAGHRLHEDTPGLLAAVIAPVVEAAASGAILKLDRERIRQEGGGLRPTRHAGESSPPPT